MIPPKPEFNAAHTINEDGISRPLNLYQRTEMKVDHAIDLLHSIGRVLTIPASEIFLKCPVCAWHLINGYCPMCAVRKPDESSYLQEVS